MQYLPTTTKELESILSGFIGPVALDTETTSLNWYDLECEGISLAHGDSVVWIERALLTPETVQVLSEALNRTVELVFHNAPFDLGVLHKLGITVTDRIFCTQTAAHLLNENGPKSLKDLSARLLKVKTVHYQEVENLPRNHPDFIKYACNDALWTLRLYEIFKPQLEEEGLNRLFYKIEMPFQFVLKDMKVRGIGADVKLANEFIDVLKQKEFELLIQLHQSANLKYSVQCDLLGNRFIDTKWNFNSSPQVVDIIQNKLGLEIPFKTDTGEPSVGKDTKKALKNRHPFIKYLDLYSRCSKLLTGFLVPFETNVDADGRIRGDFNNTVAVTGRLSSSKPNLQNLAKDSEDLGVKVRGCFRAAPGYKLIAADYSGQELRVLAELTGDPTLIKAFERGQDLHLSTANAIFNLGISDEDLCETSDNYDGIKSKYSKQRHIAKNGVLFPLIYGSTAYGISVSLGCTENEAQSYIDAFYKAYPDVKQSIDRCHQFLIKNGYVYNLSGRRRRFKKTYGKYSAKAFRQDFNFLIQGTSADMIRAAMVVLHRELKSRPEWDAEIVITVHDEVVVECKEEFVSVCSELIKHVMKTAYPLSRVGLEVEIGVGDTYSEAK